MYEHESGPGGLSHHELRQAALAAGVIEPARLGNPDAEFSPSNLWPADRSWILCTDYDLWATKVVGPEHLVEALLRDPVIEAVRLPWTS
ncbi:hypothetical protein [Streptomyces erythrochromogenes]|uniref:hypothetical protein n=1 Tax=Streptomyces erythrochromogenes TaxID=285574 RepID=UPI0037D4B331